MFRTTLSGCARQLGHRPLVLREVLGDLPRVSTARANILRLSSLHVGGDARVGSSVSPDQSHGHKSKTDLWTSSKVWQRKSSVYRGHHPTSFEQFTAEARHDRLHSQEPAVDNECDMKVALSDPARPYAIHSTLRLARGLFVTELCRYRFIIERAESLLDLSYSLLGRTITNHMLRVSIFAHFCGGETNAEVKHLLQRLSSRGIGGILDYAAEASQSDAMSDLNGSTKMEDDDYYESNVELLKESIDSAAYSSTERVGFSALKVTSIVSTGFLQRLSAVIKDPSTDITHLSEQRAIEQALAPEDVEILGKINRRLDRLFHRASKAESRVLVDAEDSSIQPGIDFLTMRAIKKYNQSSPVVYQTHQMYLKKSVDRLLADKCHIEANGAIFATKLVRGAYMEMERKRATEAGTESPVHETLEDTNNSFNTGVLEMLESIDTSSLMIASHNESSAALAEQKLAEMGRTGAKEVFFAQLLGMKDQMSLGLVNKGANVYKYLPYGPIEEVIPYLLRRSQENSQMAQEDAQSREAVIEELWGRLRGTRAQEL